MKIRLNTLNILESIIKLCFKLIVAVFVFVFDIIVASLNETDEEKDIAGQYFLGRPTNISKNTPFGEYNHRTGYFDDGSDPAGWYDADH